MRQSFLALALICIFLSQVETDGSPQYDIETGANSFSLPQQNVPAHLSDPAVKSKTPKIILQNAFCVGVNTRQNTNLVENYRPGKTWIRISFSKAGNALGHFSVPLEVFQASVAEYADANANKDPELRLRLHSDQITAMMQGLTNPASAAAEVGKLVTPGWKIQAGPNSVEITDFNSADLLTGDFALTFEEVFTSDAPPYAAGFAVIDAATTSIAFGQDAAWTTSIQNNWVWSDHQNVVEVTRESRPVSQVAYRASEKLIQLEPIIFGGKSSGCGGFTSPLMAFYDNKRPEFSGTTEQMFAQETTAWVEEDAPGYFLALDEKGDQNIRSSRQLFGNTARYANGFEQLKTLDSNHDGVIDSKDKAFSKLVLWHDKNGNSQSEKGEIQSLKKAKILKVELNYHRGDIHNYGPRAESHEWAEFVYLDSRGKEKRGKIIDIWFQRFPSKRTSDASKGQDPLK
jgi:hypothetical protein